MGGGLETPSAIDIARKKAEDRGIAVAFHVHDTLNLHGIGRTFETVIDSGQFHTLSDLERPRFVQSISEVLKS